MSVVTLGADTSVTLPIQITASSSANTKGSYVELTNSLSIDAVGMLYAVGNVSLLGANYWLVDLSTGAAGSETVLVADIPVNGGNGRSAFYGTFPLEIESGTRLAARCQCNNSSLAIRIIIYLWDIPNLNVFGCIACDTYGADTSTSTGTLIDPGTTLNTKGNYAEITSSTSQNIEQISLGFVDISTVMSANTNWMFDVATGSAGNEVVLLSNFLVTTSTTSDLAYTCVTPAIPLFISSGTRISVRAQANSTSSTRTIDIILYGYRGASVIRNQTLIINASDYADR